jgi:hypothetical protein
MLLSKSSGRDKDRTYCNKKKIIIICFQKMRTNKKIYYNLLITLMNVCQSCVLTLPKSPFLVKIFCMFDENPIGNLIFRMTSFTIFLYCSVNNQGRLVFCFRTIAIIINNNTLQGVISFSDVTINLSKSLFISPSI